MAKSSLIILSGLLFLIYSMPSALAELGPDYYIKNWRLPPYKTAIISKGDSATRPLVKKDILDEREAQLVSQSQSLMKTQPILALLLIDPKNHLIFEAYGHGASPSSLLKGHSMTKSLVSVVLGDTLCDGLIKSLNDKAATYSDTLKDTAYGDASLRELLVMSSRGTLAVMAGQPEEGFNFDLEVKHKRNLRRAFRDFGINQPRPAPKGEFHYKGLDTAALSIVIADVRHEKFQDALSERLWSKIGAEKDGEIVIDSNRDALAQSGFGATARDWGRLALFIRDLSQSNGCMGRYLRDAMTGQIPNRTDSGPAFQSYGYQFWTNNKFIKQPSAWMNGYGGQLIGIDLKSGKVAVMLSYDFGANFRLYKLFDDWTR